MNEAGVGQLCRVEEHLEQGDIYSLELVVPFATREKYIFRTQDGQHGRVALESRQSAHVFDEIEIAELYSSAEGKHHSCQITPPFGRAPNGEYELVVAPASLRRYFVVATQTCDVSGVDKQNPVNGVIVLPIQTLQDICLTTQLKFSSEGEEMTIHQFLSRNCPDTGLAASLKPLVYGEVLRAAISGWDPTPKKVQQDRNRIANLLQRMLDTNTSTYYLKASSQFGFPESVIDFTTTYTVLRQTLVENKSTRIARIASPDREHFSQKFAHFVSRVALQTTTKPDAFTSK